MSKSPRDAGCGDVRIGNQTAQSAGDAMRPFQYAVDHGFDAFEWFADGMDGNGFSFAQLDDSDCRQLVDVARQADIQFTVHAPLAAQPLYPEGQTLLKTAIDFARAIKADPVVVHMSVDQSPASFAQALKAVARYARIAGIRLAVENTPDTGPDAFNALFEAIVDIPECRPRVGMCFDLGHANLNRLTRNDYIRYLDQLGEHVPIIHLHLHENFGSSDAHLPLFTGPAAEDPSGIEQLIAKLRDREFKGCAILEQWPDPPALLCQARDRLRTMITRLAVKRPVAMREEAVSGG